MISTECFETDRPQAKVLQLDFDSDLADVKYGTR